MRKLFTLALFGVVCTAMARNIIVTGNVVDSKTNEGIDFATVQIMKGDSMVAGTTTKTTEASALKLLPATTKCVFPMSATKASSRI